MSFIICFVYSSKFLKSSKSLLRESVCIKLLYEDKGNRRFKELEMSLPNELNLEQNLEIVDKFVDEYLKNHYYAYAIHEKAGELSGESNPHVHIMFSERLIDEVEKMAERPAYKYFTRAVKPLKGEKVANFERRREHGAPKDKRCHSKKIE